ncbi:MAG: hypothetical protein GIX00_08250 [Candidatus Eremiobacteraeota bacterium]|nr:hypothetical protein [Candidatus Eremiobacteraeota bacterium]
MTMVFLVLIGALMGQMIAELGSVGSHSNSAKALNTAYAGVENMVLNIEESATGAGQQIPPDISYSYAAPSTEHYDVTVTKAWTTTNGLVYYDIVSTGTETSSGQTRTVEALAKSFPYSYFEQFTAGNSGNVYYTTGEIFDGPVYNGGSMNVWYQTSSPPIFKSSVTTVTTPTWYEGVAKTAVATPIWADVTSKGKKSFTIGSNPMALPGFQSNLQVASEAFYGDSTHVATLPNTPHNGIFVNGHDANAGPNAPLTTGLYIEGDANITPCSGVCGAYSGNNEVFTVTPKGAGNPIDHSYKIVIDFSANTTTVVQTTGCAASCSDVYTGVLSGQPAAGTSVGNGAIFADGNVTLNTGTIHGAYTISVPDYVSDHSHTITLGGAAPGIKYLDKSASSGDELGIWANDITVNSSTTTGYEFDGSIMTGYDGECPPCTDGTFKNQDWNGVPQGNFTFFGGLIQNVNGNMGVSSGGSQVSGFSRVYQYDARLASNPPPYFPITNKYDIIAWLDLGR